eukprot:7043861-Lingulodinium_polyedra.AAC.1
MRPSATLASGLRAAAGLFAAAFPAGAADAPAAGRALPQPRQVLRACQLPLRPHEHVQPFGCT